MAQGGPVGGELLRAKHVALRPLRVGNLDPTNERGAVKVHGPLVLLQQSLFGKDLSALADGQTPLGRLGLPSTPRQPWLTLIHADGTYQRAVRVYSHIVLVHRGPKVRGELALSAPEFALFVLKHYVLVELTPGGESWMCAFVALPHFTSMTMGHVVAQQVTSVE